MTEQEQRQINEEIASWFEPKPTPQQDVALGSAWGFLPSELGFWLYGDSEKPIPLDFFLSEEASARLRNTLADATWRNWHEGGCGRVFEGLSPTEHPTLGYCWLGIIYGEPVYHLDYKTAIVLAFREWMKGQGK